jgi:hypothetical protein
MAVNGGLRNGYYPTQDVLLMSDDEAANWVRGFGYGRPGNLLPPPVITARFLYNQVVDFASHDGALSYQEETTEERSNLLKPMLEPIQKPIVLNYQEEIAPFDTEELNLSEHYHAPMTAVGYDKIIKRKYNGIMAVDTAGERKTYRVSAGTKVSVKSNFKMGDVAREIEKQTFYQEVEKITKYAIYPYAWELSLEW